MAKRLLVAGLAAVAAAVLGWGVTFLAAGWAAYPDTVEDLTGVWTEAGPTPLGGTAAVGVPPGQTLVAFLVGTDLRGFAGTTSGSCKATSSGGPIGLRWPVLLDYSVDARLTGGLEAVATAGWTNHGRTTADVAISCTTIDSTVRYFVAVPSGTARLADRPWFQPWGWVTLGAAGAALIVAGVTASRR